MVAKVCVCYGCKQVVEHRSTVSACTSFLGTKTVEGHAFGSFHLADASILRCYVIVMFVIVSA